MDSISLELNKSKGNEDKLKEIEKMLLSCSNMEIEYVCNNIRLMKKFLLNRFNVT